MKSIIMPLLLLLAWSASVSATDSTPTQLPHKSNYDNEEGFAGPGSTVRQLEEDDEEKTPVMRWQAFDDALQPWFETKKKLNPAGIVHGENRNNRRHPRLPGAAGVRCLAKSAGQDMDE